MSVTEQWTEALKSITENAETLSGPAPSSSQQNTKAGGSRNPGSHQDEHGCHSQLPPPEGGQMNVKDKGKNVLATTASFSSRHNVQPQNQPSGHNQKIQKPAPNQCGPLRPSPNTVKAPEYQQAIRTPSPAVSANMQAARHGFWHQNSKAAQPASGNGQQKQHLQHPQQQQKPQQNVGPTGAASVNPAKRQAFSGLGTSEVRPQVRLPRPAHPQHLFPGQIRQTRLTAPNRVQRFSSMTGAAEMSQAQMKASNSPQIGRRTSLQQSQLQDFPEPHNQRVPQHGQNMKSEMERQGQRLSHAAFEDEEIDYDEDDDEYDEEMDEFDEDMDEEEMGYPEYQDTHVFGYPTSDSDELSEEESGLLEELRYCHDDIRYKEIVDRLKEKGVDPEEIEELLSNTNYPEDIFADEDYDDEEDDDEDYDEDCIDDDGDEAEGIVSSSSQGQMVPARNQQRSFIHQVQPPGHVQSRSLKQGVGPNQKTIYSAPSSVHSRHGVPSGLLDGVSQQRNTCGPRLQARQSTFTKHPPVHTAPQEQQSHQQQSESKILQQTNKPQRKVFQSGLSQVDPGTSQAGVKPAPENVVKVQTQEQLELSSLQTEKDVSLQGQSQMLQVQKQNQINRPSHSPSKTYGHRETTKPPEFGQSNAASNVRPSQNVNAVASNTQSRPPGHMDQQIQPCQAAQQVSNVAHASQQGRSGTSQVNPPVTRAECSKPASHLQQKPDRQPGMSNAPNSGQVMQKGKTTSPQLRAALDGNTAPSEASLARLKVEYMQQSLDREIMAKKGAKSSLQSQNNRQKFNSPQNLNQVAPGGEVRPQKHHGQMVAGYQPKHQLPPRQPIPAIVNPNLNTSQTSSDGRPICSVVPFTSNSPAQMISTNVQKLNTSQQSEAFVRPQNPAPSVHQDTAGSLLQSPDVAWNGINNSPAPVGSASSSSLPRSSAQSSVPHSSVPSAAIHSSPPSSTAHSSTASSAPISSASSSSSSTPRSAPSSVSHISPPLTTTNTAINRGFAPGNTSSHVSNQHSNPDPIQQVQPQVSALNLDNLSQDKCIITGKGKQQGLMVNMVYQIKSPVDGSLVLALWNGKRFEDLQQAGMKGLVTAGGSRPSQKPRPDGQKEQNLQTTQIDHSKTELHSATSQDSNSEQTQVADVSQKSAGAAPPPSQATFVKPLAQEQAQLKEQPVDENDDNFVFKEPFSENEDHFRTCLYCGYSSKDFKRCESCRRLFRAALNTHVIRRESASMTSSSSSFGAKNSTSDFQPPEFVQNQDLTENIDSFEHPMSIASSSGNVGGRGRGRGANSRSQRARGGGLKTAMGVRRSRGRSFDGIDSGEPLSDEKGEGIERCNESGKRRPVQTKGHTPRKRTKKALEPVTVTISSDEDEPSSTSNSFTSSAHHLGLARYAGSESAVFPQTQAETAGASVREFLEDEDSNSRLMTEIQQQMAVPYMDGFDEDDDDDEDEDEPPVYEIDIRSVRIGSMRTQPEGPLLINLQGVCFKVRSERTEEDFECEILAEEVEHVKYFSGEIQPVLFLFLTQECGEKLRNICHMEAGDEEYFDPSSLDMKQKMVVVIIESFNYMSQGMLRETLSLWADLNKVEDEYFIEELTEESSNDLLIQSAPPVLTMDVDRDVVNFRQRLTRETNNMAIMPMAPNSPADDEPDSTSSSPPQSRHHHYGSSIRLLQYPPPPARRLSITTEDLFCLTEGEFLNDVIIDFYLQYLYHEKLSEENRRRTHIFSSFFYKRLTQRDRHNEKTEEDAKKSVQERRHARVKKWTKTVDLFSKDFIIIPINEHSHWYLAVICFPGLTGPEVVPYIPSATHKEDIDDDGGNDNAGGEDGANEEAHRHSSMPKTILGQQLDAKQCLDSEDSKYNIGRKQPCILIFDSLAGPNRTPNIRMLRDYLQCEWNAKKSEQRQITKILRGSTPRAPQQSNFSDCGVFLLQYVESFFEDPIADFQIPMKGLQHWFPVELVYNKRRKIHDLIMSLHRHYQMERGDPHILDLKFESAPREPPMRFHHNAEVSDKHEESLGSGVGKDDECSNSSVSGEINRPELAFQNQAGTEDNSSQDAEYQDGTHEGFDEGY